MQHRRLQLRCGLALPCWELHAAAREARRRINCRPPVPSSRRRRHAHDLQLDLGEAGRRLIQPKTPRSATAALADRVAACRSVAGRSRSCVACRSSSGARRWRCAASPRGFATLRQIGDVISLVGSQRDPSVAFAAMAADQLQRLLPLGRAGGLADAPSNRRPLRFPSRCGRCSRAGRLAVASCTVVLLDRSCSDACRCCAFPCGSCARHCGPARRCPGRRRPCGGSS